MKLPGFSRPQPNDQPDVPKEHAWFFEAMEPRDKQLSELSKATGGKLDRENNLNDEIRTVSLKHDTEVELAVYKMAGNPIGVVPIWNSLYDYAMVTWEQSDERKIRLKVHFSTTPTAYVTTRLLIMGGG